MEVFNNLNTTVFGNIETSNGMLPQNDDEIKYLIFEHQRQNVLQHGCSLVNKFVRTILKTNPQDL